MDGFIGAEEAATLLGVTVDTLYVYVSRKRIRSEPVPNSRKRRYWRADVERLLERRGPRPEKSEALIYESALTLMTADDVFYRGQSVLDFARTASLETTAALLWDVAEDEVFTADLPHPPAALAAVRAGMAGEASVDQAFALFPLLERANPRAQNLTKVGMARTGADLIRWFCALTLGREGPEAKPVHRVFAQALDLDSSREDLVRRLLVLSADHGMEPATFAVRAVASTGVSPWRSVPTGLAVALGRRSRLGQFPSMGRLVSEILRGESPQEPITRRFHEGDGVVGFSDEPSVKSEPRARALLATFEATMAHDADYRRLSAAFAAAADVGGLTPTFALLSTFGWRKVGLKSSEAPFLLARSVGWIAHAIEQYQAGERERREPHYRGPLPAARASAH